MIRMKRAEAKAQIRASILDRLRAELEPGGRLEGLDGIYDGERVRSIPELPAVFLIRESESVEQSRLHEMIDYELSLLAIVSDETPDAGLDAAEWWAAEASAVLTTGDRTLGLPYVNDVKLIRSVPVADPYTGRRRVATVDTIHVTYTILQG